MNLLNNYVMLLTSVDKSEIDLLLPQVIKEALRVNLMLQSQMLAKGYSAFTVGKIGDMSHLYSPEFGLYNSICTNNENFCFDRVESFWRMPRFAGDMIIESTDNAGRINELWTKDRQSIWDNALIKFNNEIICKKCKEHPEGQIMTYYSYLNGNDLNYYQDPDEHELTFNELNKIRISYKSRQTRKTMKAYKLLKNKVNI